MSSVIPWIAAEAERTGEFVLISGAGKEGFNPEDGEGCRDELARSGGSSGLVAGEAAETRPCASLRGSEWRKASAPTPTAEQLAEILREYEEIRNEDERRERRILRGRTIGMLRRYLRYSIETGRLPSVLGQEFFRAKVTSYDVVTFEDRVIFVHDMERCLDRLDEFSRQLLARRILQEHDQIATARLLHCTERTVRRLTPFVLDRFSDILVKMGLLNAVEGNCCQGGLEEEIAVSDCDEGGNNF
jgi:hypothetical protein